MSRAAAGLGGWFGLLGRCFDHLLAAAAAIACLSGGIACSTTYQPVTGGRVGIVVRHGAAFYIKDGRAVPIGPLGGDLEPLVESSPPAAAHARRAFRQLSVGVPLYLLSAAAVVTGIASSRPVPHWTLIGAGAAGGVTGLGLMGAGFTNLVDAVNIYNDAAPLRAPP